jgi:hypothetical protein
MIDVTGDVPSRRAVDGSPLVELEHISRASRLVPISFLCGNAPAAVGRDVDPSFNRLCREQTESGRRTAKPKGARGHGPRITANS